MEQDTNQAYLSALQTLGQSDPNEYETFVVWGCGGLNGDYPIRFSDNDTLIVDPNGILLTIVDPSVPV